MKKISILLLLFLMLVYVDEASAAEVIHSVDEAVLVMNDAIEEHSAEIPFEAYLNIAHEDFEFFFKNTLMPRFEEQYTDHPYLVKETGVSYSCMNGRCSGKFIFSYHAPQNEYNSYKQHIQQLASSRQHLTYEEKIAFVNNYIIQKTEYDYSLTSSPSPYSPVTIYRKGLGVCQAYGLFAYDLLNALGVTNYLLDGIANNEAHLWNVMKTSDGKIVHLDTTWNDTSRTNNYYLLSTEQIAQTHNFSEDSLKNITNRLNAVPAPPNPDDDLKPDYTHHAMYVYAKEFLETKHTIQHLTDLGTLTDNKAFEIKFNQNVRSSQDFKLKVFITDNTGQVIDVNAVIDGSHVRIYKEEDETFKPTTVYNLVILKGIESAMNRTVYLKDSLYVTFKVN